MAGREHGKLFQADTTTTRRRVANTREQRAKISALAGKILSAIARQRTSRDHQCPQRLKTAA
jgi:hypothetical protein